MVSGLLSDKVHCSSNFLFAVVVDLIDNTRSIYKRNVRFKTHCNERCYDITVVNLSG